MPISGAVAMIVAWWCRALWRFRLGASIPQWRLAFQDLADRHVKEGFEMKIDHWLLLLPRKQFTRMLRSVPKMPISGAVSMILAW